MTKHPIEKGGENNLHRINRIRVEALDDRKKDIFLTSLYLPRGDISALLLLYPLQETYHGLTTLPSVILQGYNPPKESRRQAKWHPLHHHHHPSPNSNSSSPPSAPSPTGTRTSTGFPNGGSPSRSYDGRCRRWWPSWRRIMVKKQSMGWDTRRAWLRTQRWRRGWGL